MLSFRHMSLCREIKKFSGIPLLDPAFISREAGGIDVINFKEAIESSSGVDIEHECEFILKKKSDLPKIQRMFPYIFFIVADEEYMREMPIFFREKWDPTLKIDDLINVGWSIYAFTEPAIMFGDYPISISEEGLLSVRDPSLVNKFGLLKNISIAERYVSYNNKYYEDYNCGHWRPIGVFTNQETYEKLQLLTGNQTT